MVVLKISPRLSFPFSVLLLFHHLLFLTSTTTVAQRNDIFSDLSATGACDCCDVSVTSRCCLDCLQASLQVRSRAAPEAEDEDESSPLLSSRFSRESAGRGYMAAAARKAEAKGRILDEVEESGLQESHLGACQCCSKSVSSDVFPRLQMLALTCCSLCHDLHVTTPPRRHHKKDDVSGDVNEKMTSPVKRMTSMDCMCCMNSGISDCCSKCRIF